VIMTARNIPRRYPRTAKSEAAREERNRKSQPGVFMSFEEMTRRALSNPGEIVDCWIYPNSGGMLRLCCQRAPDNLCAWFLAGDHVTRGTARLILDGYTREPPA